MANTKISELAGEHICVSRNETYTPALGDGAAKAGMAVGIDTGGKVVAIDADSATLGLSFIGILDEKYDIDVDTVITDAVKVDVIVPKSGDLIKVFVEDPTTTVLKGKPFTYGATTAGSFVLNATLATGNTICYLHEPIISGSLVAIMRWA